jgi:hypothetical protein
MNRHSRELLFLKLTRLILLPHRLAITVSPYIDSSLISFWSILGH